MHGWSINLLNIWVATSSHVPFLPRCWSFASVEIETLKPWICGNRLVFIPLDFPWFALICPFISCSMPRFCLSFTLFRWVTVCICIASLSWICFFVSILCCLSHIFLDDHVDDQHDHEPFDWSFLISLVVLPFWRLLLWCYVCDTKYACLLALNENNRDCNLKILIEISNLIIGY